MPSCPFCGYTTNQGGITCPICSSHLPEADGPVAALSQVEAMAVPMAEVSGDGRQCPACGKIYTSEYADTFCLCGVELVPPRVVEGVPLPEEKLPEAVVLPPVGTRCLVLYDVARQPRHYFPLTKDVTLIGRLDAVAGVFPDIDLAAHLDEATARKVSRRHALILHSRLDDTFALRPLAGNTGTQIEADMVLPLHDYPLEPGRRFILGGAVRCKLEVIR